MKKILHIMPLCIGLLIALPSANATEARGTTTNVTLRWSRNPEPDITGYVVCFGAKPGVYIRSMPVATTTATVAVPSSGTIYFAVTAYNSAGIESGFSEEVIWP